MFTSKATVKFALVCGSLVGEAVRMHKSEASPLRQKLDQLRSIKHYWCRTSKEHLRNHGSIETLEKHATSSKQKRDLANFEDIYGTDALAGYCKRTLLDARHRGSWKKSLESRAKLLQKDFNEELLEKKQCPGCWHNLYCKRGFYNHECLVCVTNRVLKEEKLTPEEYACMKHTSLYLEPQQGRIDLYKDKDEPVDDNVTVIRVLWIRENEESDHNGAIQPHPSNAKFIRQIFEYFDDIHEGKSKVVVRISMLHAETSDLGLEWKLAFPKVKFHLVIGSFHGAVRGSIEKGNTHSVQQVGFAGNFFDSGNAALQRLAEAAYQGMVKNAYGFCSSACHGEALLSNMYAMKPELWDDLRIPGLSIQYSKKGLRGNACDTSSISLKNFEKSNYGALMKVGTSKFKIDGHPVFPLRVKIGGTCKPFRKQHMRLCIGGHSTHYHPELGEVEKWGQKEKNVTSEVLREEVRESQSAKKKIAEQLKDYGSCNRKWFKKGKCASHLNRWWSVVLMWGQANRWYDPQSGHGSLKAFLDMADKFQDAMDKIKDDCEAGKYEQMNLYMWKMRQFVEEFGKIRSRNILGGKLAKFPFHMPRKPKRVPEMSRNPETRPGVPVLNIMDAPQLKDRRVGGELKDSRVAAEVVFSDRLEFKFSDLEFSVKWDHGLRCWLVEQAKTNCLSKKQVVPPMGGEFKLRQMGQEQTYFLKIPIQKILDTTSTSENKSIKKMNRLFEEMQEFLKELK